MCLASYSELELVKRISLCFSMIKKIKNKRMVL